MRVLMAEMSRSTVARSLTPFARLGSQQTGPAFHDLVVETGHWYAGKEILIPVNRVESISYEESRATVSLTQADIKQTAENEVARHKASAATTK